MPLKNRESLLLYPLSRCHSATMTHAKKLPAERGALGKCLMEIF